MVTLHTEAAVFSPTKSSASPPSSTLLIKDIPSSLSQGRGSPPEMHLLTSGSHMLSKQGWEELKPIIRHLYLDQNQTLKQLSEYMQEHYRVKPTKKQLTHRISAWGFEKNVKAVERRAILQSLSPELQSASFETKSIRGRTLTKAKLERWMKREGMTVDTARNRQDGVSNTPAIPSSQSESTFGKEVATNLPVIGEQSRDHAWLVAAGNDIAFDWKVVDVIGSPRLGRLIGALTVETCDNIPFIDLTTAATAAEDPSNQALFLYHGRSKTAGSEEAELSNESTEELCSHAKERMKDIWHPMSPKIAPNSSKMKSTWTQRPNFVYYELYPFTSRERETWTPIQPQFCQQKRFLPTTSAPWSESECATHFKRLASMIDEEITRLVASIAEIALGYYASSQYCKAEQWYRRALIAIGRFSDPKASWVTAMSASLAIVSSVLRPGRYAEARDLHQNLHVNVQRHLGLNHPLVLSSRCTRLVELRWFGKQDEEEKATRELVQTRLNLQGPRDDETLDALHHLGLFLQRQSRFPESEYLLSTVITLRTEIIEKHPEPYQDSACMGIRQEALYTMLALVYSLNKTGKINQSKTLLQEAKKRFQDILNRRDRSFFRYQSEVACTKRLAGNLEESEMILRDLLRAHGSAMSPNRKLKSARELGEILYETNRLEEATSWFEKEFAVLLDNVGLENPNTKTSCMRVGLSYGELRRYDEAIDHFERMIERVNQANPDSTHDQQEYIQEIKGWMKEVNDMRLKDREMHLQEIEDSMSDDTPTEDSSEDESNTLETHVEFTPLEYSPICSP